MQLSLLNLQRGSLLPREDEGLVLCKASSLGPSSSYDMSCIVWRLAEHTRRLYVEQDFPQKDFKTLNPLRILRDPKP